VALIVLGLALLLIGALSGFAPLLVRQGRGIPPGFPVTI
jgi:hypothetical protein